MIFSYGPVSSVQAPVVVSALDLPPAVVFSQDTGVVPTYLWLGDSLTDVVQGAVLAVASGAQFNQPTTNLFTDTSLYGGGQFEFAANSMDGLDAANAGVCDATTKLAVFHVFRTSALPAAANQSLLGKRGGANLPGYELVLTPSGYPLASTDVGAPPPESVQIPTNLADGRWNVVGFAVDTVAGTLEIATKDDYAATTQLAGSLTNTSAFAIGQQRINAARADVALTAVSTAFTFSAKNTLQDAVRGLASGMFWAVLRENI